jgi:hypothetical protein
LQNLCQPRQRLHAAGLAARLDFSKVPGTHGCCRGKLPLGVSTLTTKIEA